MAANNMSFWRRRRTWIVFSTIALLLMSMFLLTRSFVLSPIIATIIKSKLGTEVEVKGARWNWGSGVTMDEVVLTASGVEGLASEVISVQHASITFDSSIPNFNAGIQTIDIESVRIRIAESLQHAGEFNFSHLLQRANDSGTQESPSSTKDKTSKPLPIISLQEVIVETGVMQSGDWSIENSETFTVSDVNQLESQTTLNLINRSDSMNVTLSMGQSPVGVVANIESVQLDNSIFELLPRTARSWCEQVQLQGGIESLDITWNPIQGLQITAIVEDVQFQLPEEHGVPWAVFRDGGVKRIHGDASLDVKHGIITYDGRSVLLNEVRGELVPPQQELSNPLKFSAEMEIHNFENAGDKVGAEWMSSMLDSTPFEATFTIHDFSSNNDQPGAVCVPLAAAQMLKIFQLEDWEMNAKVRVSRADVNEKIHVGGEMTINAETGNYVNFPYPLTSIRSSIEFDQSDIKIVSLQADGSNDAKVFISGDVTVITDGVIVALDLTAGDATIDQQLHDAVPNSLARVMDSLFDQDAYKRIIELENELHGSTFSLGGKLDLQLKIEHDDRTDSGVELSGSIAYRDIGILLKDFQYPLVLRNGHVILDNKGLHVPEDSFIRFEGYSGGKGWAAGSIVFLEGGGASPVLSIKLESENANPILVEAVSESAGESYELAAGILGGLGLDSEIFASGTVIGDENGKIDTEFVVEIVNGTSRPNEKFAYAINATGPFWPENFEFTSIDAEIHIKNGAVSMDGVTCKCGDGSLEASMSIDKGEFELVIRGDELPLSPQFVDVLPTSASKKLSSAWRQLDPSGIMNAVIRMSNTKENSELHMDIDPQELHISGMGRSTDLDLSSGSIVVEGTNVFFNDLEFQLTENDEPQGALSINGEVHGDKSEFDYFIDSSWEDAQIDSPLSRAITGIMGGTVGVEYFDSISPSGEANATLCAHGDLENIAYNIELIPAYLNATFHNRKAVAVFEERASSLGNSIRFTNGGIQFDELNGKLGEGDFSLQGTIDSDETIYGEFDFTWSGPTGDESLFAMLPKEVGDILFAIDTKDGKSVLPNGQVTFQGSSWDELLVAFAGDIHLDEVSMDVGIPLKEIKGIAHVQGRYKEQLSAMELSMAFEELSTLGRVVNDVEGSLEFEPSQKRFIFNDVRGESSTGSVTVEGWVATDDSKEYELEILIAGIELATGKGKDVIASLEGDLKGWISVAGIRGDTQSRRGVGMIRVEDGQLKIDPLSLTTMKILQLALPTASTITGAIIELYINGDQIILEEITLRSSESDITDLVLEGEGTVDFETFQIKARLHPRIGLPIIRDIAGILNDQLYSIDVTGELLDPKVSVSPLPFLSPQDN